MFKVVITNKIFVHCVLKRNFVSFFSLCVKKKVVGEESASVLVDSVKVEEVDKNFYGLIIIF